MTTTTAGEVEFLARVDAAERVGVLIERMAAAHGDAPIADDYLTGPMLAELLRDDAPEPPAPAAPALVPCDSCRGTGRMWAGSGLEMAQVRVTCVACRGAGMVEPGEEPADLPTDDGAPFDPLVREPDPEPEPDPPAAPNVVPFPRRPFDRAAHCQAIAAGGGARTVALYGAQHMRAIGKAGARATIRKHGYDTFAGIIKAKGWTGPRTPDLAADLALGEYLADAA